MERKVIKILSALILCTWVYQLPVQAQTPTIPESKETRSSGGAWFGLYTKYHISNKWSYYGEYHIRRRNGFKDMAQIYLRFGATYKIAKYLDFTAGFVNPYYWAPTPLVENDDRVVPQYRAWEQAALATPFDHIKVYHQLRFEQRFKRDFEKGSEYHLTHRFRYKLTVHVPLNKQEFKNHTLFASFYEEIFIQAGKTIVYDHLEDNRVFAGLGYNINPTLQVQTGYMYTFRHDGAPWKYENRHIWRLSLYHHLDLHLDKHREERDIPIH